MPAGIRNIEINQGSDYTETYIIKVDGVVLDLTGMQGRAQMREDPADVSPAGTFVVTITAVEGKVVVTMAYGDTASLSPGKYFWDLDIYATDLSSDITYLRGIVEVIAEVSR